MYFELLKNGGYSFTDIDDSIHVIYGNEIARFFIDSSPSIISTDKGESIEKKYFIYFKSGGFAIVTKDVFDEILPLFIERKSK